MGDCKTYTSCCDLGLCFAVLHASPAAVLFNGPSPVTSSTSFSVEALKFLLASADQLRMLSVRLLHSNRRSWRSFSWLSEEIIGLDWFLMANFQLFLLSFGAVSSSCLEKKKLLGYIIFLWCMFKFVVFLTS